VFVMSALVVGMSWAEPASDPSLMLAERWVRANDRAVFLGVPDRSAMVVASWLSGLDDGVLFSLYERELASGGTTVDVDVVPVFALSFGEMTPNYLGGDLEIGLGSARVMADVSAYWRKLEMRVTPRAGIDVHPDDLAADIPEVWVGWRGMHGGVGTGVQQRFVGPGRQTSLTLSDNARPAPLINGWFSSGELGDLRSRFRAEAGVGWFNVPRSDVVDPKWLLMDFRWLVVPQFEVGLSRVGIFGGDGRPQAPIGQLIIPTQPHVYNDPDQLEPDQDEMAAIDVRLSLPLGRWTSRPEDHVSGWWQHAGEDVIGREILSIPVPALAGVANMYGVELGLGQWLVQMEVTEVMDDYFRWYTGHRIYHDGFTQGGRSMGYAPGGDAGGIWGGITWLTTEIGASLHAEHVRRVGVAGRAGDKLHALSVDEVTTSIGLGWWLFNGARGWWRLDLSAESISGQNFTPGHSDQRLRVSVGLSP